MYIFEPLRTCTMYLSTHHGHSWTLVASNGLHFHKKWCFMCKILLFLNFYSSTWLDLPSGPKEGKVLRYTLLQDLKKVYCMGGSLEARWPSNGGHELSLKKPLHDVPFRASHSMYIVMVHFIVGICDLSWPLMASNCKFFINYLQIQPHQWIIYCSRTSKRYIVWGVH